MTSFRQAQLRRAFRVVNGGTPTSEPNNWDGDVPWATPVDLGIFNGGIVRATGRSLSELGLASGSSAVPSGSLIVSTRAPIGYVAQVSERTAFNQGCRGLVPTGTLDVRYFRYQLLAMAEVLQSRGQGSTFQELSSDGLAGSSIFLPGLAEQRAIADYLDRETARIDALIGAEKRRVALAEERLFAEIQSEVLGRTDTAARKNDPPGPLYPTPGEWSMRRNKTFIREVTHLSEDGSEELLTVSHLTGVTPRTEKEVTMFLAESNAGYKRVQRGDLVINTMWAWMGALGVSNYDGIVSPAYGVYQFTDRNADPQYFDALFRSRAYVEEMTRYSKGVWSSRLRLYPDSFLSIRSPFPPPSTQRRIVERIRSREQETDQLSALLKRSVGLLQERRQALITAAVTGELEVPGMAA